MSTTTVIIKNGNNTSNMDLQSGETLVIKATKMGVNVSQSGGGVECNIAQGKGAIGKVVNTTTVTQQTVKGSGNVTSGIGSVSVNHFSS